MFFYLSIIPGNCLLNLLWYILMDVENKGLPSSCGEALSVEITMWGQVTQGQTS